MVWLPVIGCTLLGMILLVRLECELLVNLRTCFVVRFGAAMMGGALVM